MSIDPSEGLAQDNNAMTLIDPVDQFPVAEFKSPYISQPNMCKLMCRFLDEYCPRSMIVIENNKGRELINRFIETKYQYNLYYDDGKLLDKVIDKTYARTGQMVQEAYERRAYGLSTTRTNRPQYFAILENLMVERKDVFCTPYLIKDICGLIRKPNGRIEAGNGEDDHDDNIMSYLMGLFIYYNSEYEKLEQYGIRRGEMDKNLEDYDESGNLTQEGTLKKLASLIPSLPDSMKELVQNVLREKDPVKESQAYYKELEMYKRRSEENQDIIDLGLRNGEIRTPTPYALDDSFWNQYDNEILKNNINEFNQGSEYNFGYNNSDTFNIEDYLD